MVHRIVYMHGRFGHPGIIAILASTTNKEDVATALHRAFHCDFLQFLPLHVPTRCASATGQLGPEHFGVFAKGTTVDRRLESHCLPRNR